MRRSITLRLTDSRPAQPAKRNMSSPTFDRRQVLKSALASAMPLALGACAGDKNARRDPLVVGGLPVTCNLTLPVACTAKDASIKAGHATNDFTFQYNKYSGWP